MTTGRRRPPEAGALLVELAVVLPVFLCLVLGSVTAGDAYARRVSVLEAVREGARYGASLALGSGPTALTDWENSVKARVVAASGGELTTAAVCAKLVFPTGATDCGAADPAGASAEAGVHLVKVSASRSATIEWFFFSTSATLKGKLAARYERDTG